MQRSRLNFIVAVAINAVVPLLVGAVSISIYFAVQNATMQLRENKGAAFAAAHAPLAAIGMFALTISFAFLVFLLPCILTSFLLAASTFRLLSKSKVFYIVSTTALGTGTAAFWLFLCALRAEAKQLGFHASLITLCAGIGFLASSSLVSLICKPSISN